MTPTMTHVALHVHDFDACLHFYREYCGMHVVHERPGSEEDSSVVWLSEPGRERELIFVLIPGGSCRGDELREWISHEIGKFARQSARGARGDSSGSPPKRITPSATTAACAIPTGTTSSSPSANPSGRGPRRRTG